MQKLENIFRLFFFLVFCAAGTCAVALAVLGPEWKSLYQLKAAIRQTEQNNRKIEEIIKDHQILSAQITSDANILKRIAPVTLGQQLQDANQPVARITADTLARAKDILRQQTQDGSDSPEVPQWLQRCTAARNRIILFAAGTGLVVVSFACFGKRKSNVKMKKEK
jgi:hypothetical protein